MVVVADAPAYACGPGIDLRRSPVLPDAVGMLVQRARAAGHLLAMAELAAMAELVLGCAGLQCGLREHRKLLGLLPIKWLRAGGAGTQSPQEDDAEESKNSRKTAPKMRESQHLCPAGAGLSQGDPWLCVPASRRVCLCLGALGGVPDAAIVHVSIGAGGRRNTPYTTAGRMSASAVPRTGFRALDTRVACGGLAGNAQAARRQCADGSKRHVADARNGRYHERRCRFRWLAQLQGYGVKCEVRADDRSPAMRSFAQVCAATPERRLPT